MLFKRNGENGVVINKTMIALVSLIIVIITTTASIVGYSVATSSTAEQALELAEEVKQEQQNQIKMIQQNKEDIAVVNAQYKEIIRRLENIEQKVDNLG